MLTRLDQLEEELLELARDFKSIDRNNGVGFISGLPKPVLLSRAERLVQVLKSDYGKNYGHYFGRRDLMHREIKFRAWDELMKVMHGPESLAVMDSELSYMPAPDYSKTVWMQYIGLKDDVGKEVYEDDIVKVVLADGIDEPTDIGVMKWMAHEARFVIDLRENDKWGFDEIDYVEVIGNIWEHPEKLEEGK